MIDGLARLKQLSIEPGYSKHRKKRTVWIGNLTFDEFLRGIGMDKYKMQVKDYIRRQNILSELHKYGNTKKEIKEVFKKHLEECQDCANKYLDWLSKASNGLMNLLKRTDLETENPKSARGLFYILRKLDKKYLSILN